LTQHKADDTPQDFIPLLQKRAISPGAKMQYSDQTNYIIIICELCTGLRAHLLYVHKQIG